jgi:hypothetical protein
MIALITESDFTPYKAISANLNAAKKLLPYVVDAQQLDLKELIGSAFYLALYKDVTDSPALQLYSDLWNGSEWVCNNKTYRHEGLKTVLVHFSYARYIMNSGQEETAFGVVVKKEENSEPISEKTLLRKIDNANSAAFAYFKDVEMFLNDNHASYPLWNYACEKRERRSPVTDVQPLDQRHKPYKKYRGRDRYS